MTFGLAPTFRPERGASAVGPAPLGLVGRNLFRRWMHDLLEGFDLELIGQLKRLVIEGDVVVEDIRHSRLLEDSLPRAFRLARATVNAFVGVDIELVGEA